MDFLLCYGLGFLSGYAFSAFSLPWWVTLPVAMLASIFLARYERIVYDAWSARRDLEEYREQP